MKKNIILLSIFSLLLAACNLGNPAERAVKKMVEAFHNNDIDGVKKYYVLYELNYGENALRKIRRKYKLLGSII